MRRASPAARYRQGVVDWDAAQDDPRRANRLFRRNHAHYKELRSTAEGRDAIVALLDDEDVAVRLVAATDCLPWASERGIPVLEEIERADGRFAIDAKYTLLAFRAGTLDLDW